MSSKVSVAPPLLGALLWAALVGCSGSQEEPWQEEVLAASRLDGISVEQQRALADGAISRQEYESAVAEVAECAARGGAEVTKAESSRGIFSFEVETRAAGQLEAFEECNSYSANPVNYLYPAMLANPEKEDYDTLVMECLSARGITTSADGDMKHKVRAALETDPMVTTECMEEPRAFID